MDRIRYFISYKLPLAFKSVCNWQVWSSAIIKKLISILKGMIHFMIYEIPKEVKKLSWRNNDK